MAIGLYIHVPFCLSKCPYCDFYSGPPTEEGMDRYTDAVCRSLREWGGRRRERADTLYFGGGTPSLLGGRRLQRILEQSREVFGLEGAEITLEANPADELKETLRCFAAAGGNRLSLGMQSADREELRWLGRRHTPDQVLAAAEAARKAGIQNLSLDMMLGLEGQTPASVARSAAVCAELGAAHVSAYLLKIEPGTPLGRREDLRLPDEEGCAQLYLAACEALEKAGFAQYEISNFAKPGFSSRHNRKYWNGEPYLGIGPAAHSFLDGRRLFYPPDVEAFLKGQHPLEEEPDLRLPSGGEEEYLLLRLRLTRGVEEAAFRRRFGRPLPAAWRRRAAALPGRLVTCDSEGIRLTREGFLLSNAVISRILDL